MYLSQITSTKEPVRIFEMSARKNIISLFTSTIYYCFPFTRLSLFYSFDQYKSVEVALLSLKIVANILCCLNLKKERHKNNVTEQFLNEKMTSVRV